MPICFDAPSKRAIHVFVAGTSNVLSRAVDQSTIVETMPRSVFSEGLLPPKKFRCRLEFSAVPATTANMVARMIAVAKNVTCIPCFMIAYGVLAEEP